MLYVMLMTHAAGLWGTLYEIYDFKLCMGIISVFSSITRYLYCKLSSVLGGRGAIFRGEVMKRLHCG